MADDTDSQKAQEIIDNQKQQCAVPSMACESQQPPVNKITPNRDSYWFAHGGTEEVPSAQTRNKTPDAKDAQSQKEREERIRLFREQQEEERVRRMKELEQAFVSSRKYREQQEEERRRKIEDARVKEIERRQQVEERKRQIWEAEQERKEAILRRNLEREARIEARRNAQRNSLSFAFGSSTPRTFDLDLAALGRSSAVGCPLMSAVSGRRSEERDFASKRATSACSLDRKPEPFDFSFGGDCTDASDNDRWRSMSVEREPVRVSIAKQNAFEQMNSEQTKACLTMDDNFSLGVGNSSQYISHPSSRWLVGSGAVVGDDLMSWSMISLSSSSRGRRRTDLTPITPRERSTTPHTVPRAKNTSRSPSRPQSSMSGRSEISITSSQASAVSLRPKTAPKKPRPFSIAGTTVDRNAWNSSDVMERKPRAYERNVSAPKPPRAKSNEPENPIKNSAVKKPVPPPKSAQVLAKARSHPVPTKDNLRKVVKVLPESKSDSSKNSSVDAKEVLIPQVLDKIKTPSPPKELLPSKSENVDVQEELKVQSINIPPESDKEISSVTNQNEDKPNEAVAKSDSEEDVVKSEPQLENPPEQNSSKDVNSNVDVNVSKRIISEEEAKAALAEKRRLAREQAEREAELERQRQEELQRQEEERRLQEELEQKRLEEEQIRLAELHRKLEEEKLKKAIEEQQQREQEEKERREEEARQKAEKEEQERKAREEAEKQRIELEERLRKEEIERAERKRRVEQIMSRTRGKGSQSTNNSTSKEVSLSSENNMQTVVTTTEADATNANNSGGMLNNNSSSSISSVETSLESLVNTTTMDSSVISNSVGTNSAPRSDIQSQLVDHVDLDALMHNANMKNGFHSDSLEQTFVRSTSVNNTVPNRTSNKDSAYATHTNGYSHHEETSLMSSPEERSEKSDSSEGLLLDLQSTRTVANNVTLGQTEIHQLIDISSEETTTNSHNDNYVIDVVNSNIVSTGNPFLVYEDNLPKKQENNTFTDLLS